MENSQHENTIQETSRFICNVMSTSFYETRLAQCVQAFLNRSEAKSQELSENFAEYQSWAVEILSDKDFDQETHQLTLSELLLRIEMAQVPAQSSVEVPSRYAQLIETAKNFEDLRPETVFLSLCEKGYISIENTIIQLDKLIDALKDLNVVYKTYSHKFKNFNKDQKVVNFIALSPFRCGFFPFKGQASATQIPPLKTEIFLPSAFGF